MGSSSKEMECSNSEIFKFKSERRALVSGRYIIRDKKILTFSAIMKLSDGIIGNRYGLGFNIEKLHCKKTEPR